MGTQLLPPQKGTEPPQFSAHLRCGQTAEWIKMPLGTEVGLGQNDFTVKMGTKLPRPKEGAQPRPPIFGSGLLSPNGWMDQDAT